MTGGPETMNLSTVADDGIVRTTWYSRPWGWVEIDRGRDWVRIGGVFPPARPLAALTRPFRDTSITGYWDLFVTGNNGVVYTSETRAGDTNWNRNDTNTWRAIGGFFPPGAPIAALARYPNHLDLFITGNDGVVYTSWWHEGGDWSGMNDNWRPIGGFFPPGAPIAALARYPNHLDLFITGNDGVVYTSWYHEGGDWSGIHHNWRPIGGFFPPGNPIAAVCRTPANIDLFIVGNDHKVYQSWYQEGSEWSGINSNWRPLAPP
jgi:nicotinamidase-related amidase